MDNKKIPTSIGTIILVIIAITAGVFVWTYEKTTRQDDAAYYTNSLPQYSATRNEDISSAKLKQANEILESGQGNTSGGYEDRSLIDPIETTNSATDAKLKIEFVAAKKGASLQSLSECGEDSFCVGGYAAQHKDQSICETYSFKNKYFAYPACDCGMERFVNGNSRFENCYIGYGIIDKNEASCNDLPDTKEQKNVPEYENDKTPIQKMKAESCLYGTSIGKNNVDSCEAAGFFADGCYLSFSELRQSTAVCQKINDKEMQSRCIINIAPIEGNIEACMGVEEITSDDGRFYTNVKPEAYEETNPKTEDKDRCIYNVVDTKKLTDKTVCEKIISPYYKYLCRQNVAINLKDPSLCTIEFLGGQSNANGCINVLSGH